MTRAWLTPSRISALLWLAALGVLVWLTLDPGSPLTWTDQDSVSELSAERACALARATYSNGAGGACRNYTYAPHHARIEVVSSLPYTVCFLKAARWFVADEGAEIECPSGPPMELQRITTFDDELRTERRWADDVRLRRITAAVNAFPQEFLAVLELRRSQAWPTECPPLPGGRIEALDKDKVMPTLASWHFLTGETVERVLEPSSYMLHRLEGLEKMRRKLPVLLLVDADVKVMPMNGSAGRLEATAAVIDWRKKKVYCQRTFVVTQPSPKELDHGTQIPQLPLIQDMQMMEFKVNVSNKLAELTREMTDGGLVLDPTW